MLSCSDAVYDKVKKARADLKKREETAYIDPAKGLEAKEEGNRLFTAGNFKDALAKYQDATKRDPTNAIYWANCAAALQKLGQFPAALADVERALKLDPKYVKAHVRRGQLQFALKEYHKAMETYQEALKLEPDNADAKDGLRRTVMKINETSGTDTGADAERAARAMADPEIQAILRDPMVNAALSDLQTDPTAARRVLGDPSMAAKLQKLIAAGVLKMG